MARKYIPLSKEMSDEEVVQAFKDAGAKMKAEKVARRAAQEAEAQADREAEKAEEGSTDMESEE